jgi:ACS family glucarate transporter-like MFS transporter
MELPPPATTACVTSSEKPTRARFVVLGLLCSMSFVLYLDRVCMSQALKPIKDDLSLSNVDMSFIAMAFTVAYCLFEVPTGHWGDRVGARRVLTRIVVCWSVFTALTGACWGFWSLLAVRFLFGAGEAGAFPNAAGIVRRWFPLSERGRFQGFFLSASLVGGAASPYLAGWLIKSIGWQWTFAVFGAVGLLWVAVFAWWFRDHPSRHPAVNAAELAWIGPETEPGRHDFTVPWRAVAANRNIWLLGTITTLCAFNTYLYFTWYPAYLQEARGLTNYAAGEYAALVLAGGAVGTLLGGFAGDRINRASANRRWLRRLWCACTLAMAAAFLVLSVQCAAALPSALFAAASLLTLQCQQAPWWSCAIEISGRHIGALFGLMNGVGGVGAVLSQYYVGAMADWYKALGYTGRAQWDPIFSAYCVALLAAGFFWLFVDASRTVASTARPRA